MNMIKSAGKKSFTVKDRIVVGDPCYSYHDIDLPAESGRWTSKAYTTARGDWGRRISSILVHHESFSPIGTRYSREVHYVEVDSGQAGVYDAGSMEDHDSFYEACCRASNPYGFIRGGFVSTSGYGDGYYKTTVYKKGRRAHAVEIEFIPEQNHSVTGK